MRRLICVLAMAIAALVCADVRAESIDRWKGSDGAWHVNYVDAVTGLPSDQCYMSDGSGDKLDSTGGALHALLMGGPVGGINVNIFDSAHAVLTAAAGRLTVDGSGVTQPISAVALPLPAGASTAAAQATGNASLSSIDGKIPAKGAALTAASTPVNIASDQTVPISAVALPLPLGAATEATQATRATEATVAGLCAQATCATLGTEATLAGVCTQATCSTLATEATLAFVAGDTAVLATNSPVLGQALMAASTPVAIASNQSAVPISAAALPLPTGAATAAAQTDGSQIAQARVYDGAGTTIDSRTNALAVVQEDGSGNLMRTYGSRSMPSCVPYLYDTHTGGVTAGAKYPLAWPLVSYPVPFVSGYNAAVGATPETIWPEGGVYAGFGAATALNVCSTDTDDDGAPAGTGAQTVTIWGVGSTGGLATETITMDGQTAVVTGNQYLYVQTMLVATAGSSYRNEGTIRAGTGACVGGVPATLIYQQVPPDLNKSQSAFLTTYNGSYAFVTAMDVYVDTTAAKCTIDLIRQTNGGLQVTAHRMYVNGVPAHAEFSPPLSVAARGRFEVKAACDVSSAVAATIYGWQE
jgi:hypothetical protein